MKQEVGGWFWQNHSLLGEVSSKSFLPLSAKGLRIEGCQSLTSRWVLLSVPCGELRIGRIKVNQSQQVLPWHC